MSEPTSRRRFLLQLVVLSGAAWFPQDAWASDSPGSWVAVGPAKKFTIGEFARVVLPDKYEGAVVYVSRAAGDVFLALSGRCTHQGCPVEWDAKPRQFLCPCHHGRYDETGKNIGGPPPYPLPVLNTRVDEHGNLLVQPAS